MTRSAFLRSILVSCLVATLFGTLSSAAYRWDYLGEANVDGGADHDRIKVNSGPYRRLQILVQNSTITFDRVVVHFASGADLPIAIAKRIPPGGRTREIDLPGDKRVVESVEFWYRRGNWGNGQRPKLRLMGVRW